MEALILSANKKILATAGLSLLCGQVLAAEEGGAFHRAKVKVLNAMIEENIPREFDFDKMDIRWLIGIGSDITNLRISENPAYRDHPLKDYDSFFTAEHVKVRINPIPLMLARLHVNEVTITNPKVNVIRSDTESFTENFNIDDLFEAGKGPVLSWMKIKEVGVQGADVRFIDTTAPSGPLDVHLDQITAKAYDFSLKKEFDIRVLARTSAADFQNLSIEGQAGPIVDAENFEQIPVVVNFNLRNAPITPYLAYAPPGLTALPSSGDVSIKFEVDGNAWDGLNMTGSMKLKELVLSNQDKTINGKSTRIDIGVPKDMTLSLAKKQIAINQMDVSLNKTNTLTLKGVIDDILTIPQVDVNINAEGLGLVDMFDIYPFAAKYIPEGSTYGGDVDINIDAQGDYNLMKAQGRINGSGMFFFMRDLLSKEAGSPLKLEFDAEIFPTESNIKANASLDLRDVKILETAMFSTGLKMIKQRLFLTDKILAFMTMDNSKPYEVGKVSGNFTYENDIIRFKGLKVEDLHQGDVSPGIDLIIDGRIDVAKEKIFVTGSLLLPEAQTKNLLAKNGKLKDYVEQGRIHLPVQMNGSFDNPDILIAYEHKHPPY